MLEGLKQDEGRFVLSRLAAVGDSNVRRLLARGISPESFPEIRDQLQQLKIVYEPAQIVDASFQPSANPRYPTPFPRSRFSAGDKPVFYSAIEADTAISEVRYHQFRSGQFDDLSLRPTGAPRYFNLFEIEFEGSTLDLFPIHSQFPELTSQDDDGYPKCREIADEARLRPVDALQTPSARKQSGTCTPVFSRSSLVGSPMLKFHGQFVHEAGEVVFRPL